MADAQEKYIAVLSTVAGLDSAAALARQIVEEGLAACCNIIPAVRSIYMWKGKICDEGEAMCVFKTRAALFDELSARIRELHGYEVPEIAALEIADGSDEYLAWIDSSCARR